MTLEFTTSEPGFLGARGDYNKQFVERKRKSGTPRKLIGFPADNLGRTIISIYIHGELERLTGYDIPIWLSGAITNIPSQPCLLWNLSGDTSWEAELTIKTGRDPFDEEKLVGYIQLPDQE